MALEYRSGRTAYDENGSAITLDPAGTYDTATGAWVSPFDLTKLDNRDNPANRQLLDAHGAGREAVREALVSSAMLGTDRLGAALTGAAVAPLAFSEAEVLAIVGEGGRRTQRQREIDAGAGDDFDFGNLIMAGLVAGVGYLSGGFGLQELFNSASAATRAPTALETLNTYPAEGTLYEGVTYNWPVPGAPLNLMQNAGSALNLVQPAGSPLPAVEASGALASTLAKVAPAGLAALLKSALGTDAQPLPTTAEEFNALNAQQWVALGLMGAAAIGAVYLVTTK